MNVFAINGSPTTRADSVTELLLAQLIEGISSAGADVRVARLSEKRVLPCDCGHRFACWVETPGQCIHHDEDDVEQILELLRWAEMVVFATPLYVEGMTGQMKMLLDRTLPLVEPYLEVIEGVSRHPLRDCASGKLFVSFLTCGHYECAHFDALIQTFDQVAKNLRADHIATILRPHAMVLREPARVGDTYAVVMAALQQAGRQLMLERRVDEETIQQIRAPLMPREVFIEQANERWRSRIKRRIF